jgi:mRNA interferase MazF
MDSFPQKGEFIFVSFDPARGHEQQGRRPALVVSSNYLNKSGMVWAVPITHTLKGPGRIVIPTGENVDGAVLFTQIKMLDIRERGYDGAGFASDALLDEVVSKCAAILMED